MNYIPENYKLFLIYFKNRGICIISDDEQIDKEEIGKELNN